MKRLTTFVFVLFVVTAAQAQDKTAKESFNNAMGMMNEAMATKASSAAQQAITCFTEAIALAGSPTDTAGLLFMHQAYLKRGQTYALLKEYDNAIADVTTGLNYYSAAWPGKTHPLTLQYRACLYLAKGNMSKCVVDLDMSCNESKDYTGNSCIWRDRLKQGSAEGVCE